MAMMPPAPQGAPAPAQGAPAPDQGAAPKGGASELVVQIHDGLQKLMELAQGKLPDQDLQHLGGIISEFQSFVDELGKPEGQEAPEEQAQDGGVAAPEAGGNPNARPA